MILVKYLRHSPSDFGYQGLCLFLRHWTTNMQHFDNSLSIQDLQKTPRQMSIHNLNSKSSFLNQIRESET